MWQEQKSGTQGTAERFTDIFCDLLLNRCMATWNLFVLCNEELKYTEKSFNDDVIYASVLQ